MRNSIFLRSRFFGLFFIAMIFLEIASFIIVGRMIGVFATLALLVCITLLGLALLRRQGLSLLVSLQNALATGRMPNTIIAKKASYIFAALLFIIPGFFSDILAISLLLDPIRSFFWMLFLKIFQIKTDYSFEDSSFHTHTHTHTNSAKGQTIDLDAEDYHSSRTDKQKNTKNTEGSILLPDAKDKENKDDQNSNSDSKTDSPWK